MRARRRQKGNGDRCKAFRCCACACRVRAGGCRAARAGRRAAAVAAAVPMCGLPIRRRPRHRRHRRPCVSAPNPAFGTAPAPDQYRRRPRRRLDRAGRAHRRGRQRRQPQPSRRFAARVTHNLNYVSSPPNNLNVDDVVGHGTAVSQIMAGTPFGAWPGGIAPGAQIVSARIIADKAPDRRRLRPGQRSQRRARPEADPPGPDRPRRAHHEQLLGRPVLDQPAATAPIADEYRPFISATAGWWCSPPATSRSPIPRAWPRCPASRARRQPAGRGPGARLAGGGGAGYRQPDAAGRRIPTPAAWRWTTAWSRRATSSVTGTNDSPTNPTYWNWSGTSLAAPQVSGAAALVWQAFPYFNNDLVRQTLLGTATDLGAAGVDPVFGYGLLDVGRAVHGPARLDWGDVARRLRAASVDVGQRCISGSGGITKRGTGHAGADPAQQLQRRRPASTAARCCVEHSRLPGTRSVGSGTATWSCCRVGRAISTTRARVDQPRCAGPTLHRRRLPPGRERAVRVPDRRAAAVAWRGADRWR